MDILRYATEKEIEAIKSNSDLSAALKVYACGDTLGVLRLCYELDPVYFGKGASDRQKFLFMARLEDHLRLSGIPAYYFNVPTSDEQYLKVLENFGAVKISPSEEFRYKKVLISQEGASNGNEIAHGHNPDQSV